MLFNLISIVLKPVFRLCLSAVNYLYFGYLRPVYKRILHRLSGQCEIERILSLGKVPYATKIRKIEFSLLHSRNERLRNILRTIYSLTVDDGDKVVDLARDVADAKSIAEGDHRRWFEEELVAVFRMIAGYKFLIDQVEEERTITYESSNSEHEELLMKLWSLLKPDSELQNRVSYQWTEIGFQGEDPATDFRGMGLLGLEQLVYFSEHRPERVHELLVRSMHPTIGYPFAIVGINMTSLARDLLREGALRNHFFNTMRQPPQLEDFHRTYCELFSIFDRFWTKMNPTSIMDFVPIRHQLHKALHSSLSSDESILQEIEGNP